MLILTTSSLSPTLPWWECKGEQLWNCWTLRRLFGFIQATHTHAGTQACAEVSESWLWSSGLRRLFILHPSEALKPRSDVSCLLAPVCPHSQFHNTNSSSESIPYQLYIYFFSHKSFLEACIIELFIRSVHPSFRLSSHHSLPYPPRGRLFFSLLSPSKFLSSSLMEVCSPVAGEAECQIIIY